MHKNDRNLFGVVGLNKIKTFALRILHRVDQGRVLEQPWIWIIRERSAEIGPQWAFFVRKSCAIPF